MPGERSILYRREPGLQAGQKTRPRVRERAGGGGRGIRLAAAFLAAGILAAALLALGISPAPGQPQEYLTDDAYLGDMLAALARREAGDWGIYFSVMASGEEAGYQQDKPFVAASCYKLFLVTYIYELAAAGETDLESVIVYTPADYSGGTGIIQFMPYGTAFTVRQLCRLAITHSDNVAANMLKRTYSYGAFRDYATSIGCPVTGTRDGRNMTTPREQGKILRRIMDFAAADPLGEEIIQAMKDDIYRSRIPAGISGGVEVGNKTGDYAGYMNDSAIVFTEDSPYLLVILSYGASGDAGHARISRYVFDHVESRLCTGGHCLAGMGAPAGRWYFAEGCTGEGFHQWLCLQNPGDYPSRVLVEYFTQEAGPLAPRELLIPPHSRLTVFVNGDAGEGLQLSTRVTVVEGPPVTAERPIYFIFRDHWSGGHVGAGIPAPAARWFFAEGYTGSGFEEWVTVFNPGEEAASLTFRFQTAEGTMIVREGWWAPPLARATFFVNELAGEGLHLSLEMISDRPVVAERSMYFDYSGVGGHHWTGGHCGAGLDALSDSYYFAEGTTREGFEEWLTLQNPGEADVVVTATYCFGDDARPPLVRGYVVKGHSRLTLFVPAEVGWGEDVAVMLQGDAPFAAERPVYFHYRGFGAYWGGGHCVAGAGSPRTTHHFPEGYTGPGFQQWLCFFNPGAGEVRLEVEYQVEGEGGRAPLAVSVPPLSRVTLRVNDHAGCGLQLSTLIRVTEGAGILAERPIYFNYAGFASP